MKYVHEREVWWCDFGNDPVGIEISKKRPVLILKKFNKRHFFVIPLTKTKRSPKITYDLSQVSNFGDNSYLNISQLRAIDVGRLDQQFGKLSQGMFKKVKKLSAEVLTPASEPSGQKLR